MYILLFTEYIDLPDRTVTICIFSTIANSKEFVHS